MTAVVVALLAAGCGGAAAPSALATTEPTTAPVADQPEWKQVSAVFGRKGVLHESVYTISIPRDDLSVSIEGMEVPTAAGLESTFHFYRCPCGKINVVGQFVVTDYEANDVVYALQKKNFLVSSTGPLLLYEKPRLMMVRFQGEGRAEDLAAAIRSALDWVGKARMAPQTME